MKECLRDAIRNERVDLLPFSDQPGYRFTCLGFQKNTPDLEVTLEVELVERIGWWQPGWFASLLRDPGSRRCFFVGYYVWREQDTGRRVPLNLEIAFIKLRRKMEGIDGCRTTRHKQPAT